MDGETYPGKGLSLSQLLFALNQELKRVVCSAGFTPDAVSQFGRDLFTASATVREWKNSFVPINRMIPSEILSLIPTHLSSNEDRFRATFVCRHWRRTFLQYATLWSRLHLENGEDYVTTLLERAKGSALDIVTNNDAPLGAIALLSPHVQQIRYLKFSSNHWAHILAFSQANPGPLPLLRSLQICIDRRHIPRIGQFNLSAAPSLPLFSGAVNLEEFVFDSNWGSKRAGSLNNFAFPKLTTCRLSVSLPGGFNASDLFDFLKASPTLRTVKVGITGNVISRDIPQEMVIVLPNVETFSLLVLDSQRIPNLAHISCPNAKYTSLFHQICEDQMVPRLELFPAPGSWKAITRQYSTSPVEEVTLEITYRQPCAFITFSLTFQSSDGTVIRLDVGVSNTEWPYEELYLSQSEINHEIFFQACRTIQGHPLLSHVKRLHIKDRTGSLGAVSTLPMLGAGVIGELFSSLGPLDEFTIYGCRAWIFFAPFIDLPEFRSLERVLPAVKLIASDSWMLSAQLYRDSIVELAKSQYELGVPFERMMIHEDWICAATVERLSQWVGAVEWESRKR